MAADEGDPRYQQFCRWDKDESGAVDVKELQEVLKAIYDAGLKEGKTADDAEADAENLISSLEKDEEGTVTWEELKNALDS